MDMKVCSLPLVSVIRGIIILCPYTPPQIDEAKNEASVRKSI